MQRIDIIENNEIKGYFEQVPSEVQVYLLPPTINAYINLGNTCKKYSNLMFNNDYYQVWHQAAISPSYNTPLKIAEGESIYDGGDMFLESVASGFIYGASPTAATFISGSPLAWVLSLPFGIAGSVIGTVVGVGNGLTRLCLRDKFLGNEELGNFVTYMLSCRQVDLNAKEAIINSISDKYWKCNKDERLLDLSGSNNEDASTKLSRILSGVGITWQRSHQELIEYKWYCLVEFICESSDSLNKKNKEKQRYLDNQDYRTYDCYINCSNKQNRLFLNNGRALFKIAYDVFKENYLKNLFEEYSVETEESKSLLKCFATLFNPAKQAPEPPDLIVEIEKKNTI